MGCRLRNQTDKSHTNMKKKEPGIAPCKVIKPVLDSGFYGVDSTFQVEYCGFPVSGTSGLQSSGFRIPRANISQSRIRISLHGATLRKLGLWELNIKKCSVTPNVLPILQAILGLRKFLLKANTVENYIKGLNGIFNYFLDLASKNETTTTATLPQDVNKVSSKFKFV